MKTPITTELRLESVDSTMDAARAVAGTQDFLLVSAESQTGGKGTRGRPWYSPSGNIYMTLGINRRHLPAERLALFPLEMGTWLCEEACLRLPESRRSGLVLKWPNDLLIRGAGASPPSKTAGILMESYGEFLLAGIGINVTEAPAVADGGTPSACLADHGMPVSETPALVEGLYRRVLAAFAAGNPDPEKVLLAWQAKVDWQANHRLRDRPGHPWVLPVAVNRQGHLLVTHGDGSLEWLVSDYLA